MVKVADRRRWQSAMMSATEELKGGGLSPEMNKLQTI